MDELEAGLKQLDAEYAERDKGLDDLQEELRVHQEIVKTPRTRGWFTDQLASAVRGTSKAYTSTIDGLASIINPIFERTGDVQLNVGSRASNGFVSVDYVTPEEVKAQDAQGSPLTAPSRALEAAIGEPETATGRFTQGTAQFITGLLGTKKFFKAFDLLQGTGAAVTTARNIAESAVASGAAFEKSDGNLANLVESSKELGGPDLHNALTTALETKDDDSELMGRLKNMVTDAGVGALADSLIGGIRSLRAGKQARQAVIDNIGAEVAGNKVEVNLDHEIKFAEDVPAAAAQEVRSPKTGEIVDVTQPSPAVDLKIEAQRPTTELSLETPAETVTRTGEHVTSAEATHVEQLNTVADKATVVADEAKQAIEDSKPATPLKEMSDSEAHDVLREKLGITEDKLKEIRDKVEAGQVGKEDVANLLHFNPSKFDWSMANDAESQVALMNSFTRVFSDALGKAGTGRVSLETIFAHSNKIGANVDAAIDMWKRLQGVEAGVRAQQFTVAASGAHLTRLATKVASGTGTAQDLLDLVVHDKRHALLQITAQGSRSMIGRAMRVMREGVLVSETALKLSNGRRLRIERKARDIASQAKEQAQAVQERLAKREAASKARTEANTAKQRQADAQAHVELTQEQMAEAAHKFLDKAHKERLEAEQRDAIRVAKEAVKKAEREAKDAEAVAAKAEAEVAKHESATDKKFGNNKPTAEVNLSGDTKLQFDEVHEALSNLGYNPEQVVDLAKEITKRESAIQRDAVSRTGLWSTLQDRVASLYINNILSGLPTMVVNAVGGITKMFESTFEHYGSAALATARGNKYAMIAANKAAIATWTSWASAWKIAGEAWKEGLPQTDILARAEVAIREGEQKSLVGKVITAPSRAIVTIDEFFKHIFYQQELNARAVEVAASAADLQGSALAKQKMFEKVLKETLENPPDDLVLDSIEKARYQTFQSNLESKFANDLIRLTNSTPIAKLIIPFVKTPTNIIKQGVVERSPLNLLRKSVLDEIRAGTREGNMAIVRIALGTSLIGTVWNLADQGNITGSKAGYGKNQNTGDIENIPPYSIKLGDTWYQYNRLDPFGTPLGLVADLRLVTKHNEALASNNIESDDPTLSEAFGNILGILNKNLLDKTFFKGISDFTNAVSGSRSAGDAMGNYLETVGSNLVPYSSLIRGIAKSHDDYAREAFTFSDKLMQQTPGLSQSLPVQRDLLGRPIPNAERLGPSWLSPFLVGHDDHDPVARELASLQMNYSKPDKDIAGVKLTGEQYSRLQEVRGTFLKDQMTRWMESGEWAKLTKYQKIDHVKKFLNSGTSKAESTVMQEWPELGQHIRNIKVEARSLKNGSLE